MKNPLMKRLPRELKHEWTKYMIIFIFNVIVIGFVSGFLVASGSLKTAYDESFEKYNVEYGHFELWMEAEDDLIDKLEKEDVTIYEDYYLEKETDEVDSTLRIYQGRKAVNQICLMEGELPVTDKDIAIDRMYADNNDLAVGDILLVGGKELNITGLVALSDYSSLFADQGDMMFDAIKFGVAVMTEEGFASFGEDNLHYNYAWTYNTHPEDDTQQKEWSEDFMEVIAEHAVLTNYLPRYANQAICFTSDDMGKDRYMFLGFLYVVIVIIAFIFAITTSNTITKEANVIGTLRASGYTRGELIVHYITMPVLVTIVSAIVGNVLGYTYFVGVAVDMYYANYSLPTYVTIWNADAFLQTTVIPCILMIVINLAILVDKLKLSPLKFIRRDLSKRQKKKALRLNTKIKIMNRFRLRIIFQNIPNYITIVIGIFLANVILLMGIAFPALMDKYAIDIVDNMICDYQYVLKMPVETETKGAEQYCAGSLKYVRDNGKTESITMMGIIPDSEYVKLEFEGDEVYISNALSEKYHVQEGDTLILREEFGDQEYSFEVAGIYYYPGSLNVFMSQESFNDLFDYEEDYFSGYLTDEEIKDIEEMYIATKITSDDYTKMSRQMNTSMAPILDLFGIFGVVMFMLIIYLLSKIIIEKNAQSISMTKVLGYMNHEISGLYIMSTSIVVVLSVILTIPLAASIMKVICRIMMNEYAGYLPFYVPLTAYVIMGVVGILAYAVIAWFQFGKVKKIPLDVALKNVE